MTDNEIKKALACCVSDDYDESCIKCPVRKYKGCDYTLHKNALDLINRQQAVIDDLKRDTVPKLQDSLNRANKYGRATDRENARLKAEIEKMQKYNAYVAFEQYNKGRTEAIKEFAERLKSKYINVVSCNAGYVYGTIKEVEKEMVGGENA